MRLIQPLVLWFCVSLFSPLAQADDKPVMDAKASPEQVSKMLQEAAKSDAAAWKDRPAQGVVNADPKEGGYRLEAVVSGERSANHSGLAKAVVIATIGDEQGGKVVLCAAEKSNPKPGALVMRCDIPSAFHVEKKKPVVIQFGLGSVQGLNVQEVSMQAYTGGAKAGFWVFGKFIPLLVGVVMFAYWFFFLRRR